MSSTGYQPANSRWRPTVPKPVPLSAAARRVVWWSAAAAITFPLLIAFANVIVWTSRGSPTAWSTFLFWLGIVGMPLIALNGAVTWWLIWRMAKAEAGGLGG